jgi:PTH1 family peptidyl-tRNA hydrolase
VKKTDFKGKFGEGNVNGEKIVLVKPQTFMNLSGECIKPLMDYYHANPKKDLVVISDDVMIEPGRVRIRKKGSAGGHNGLKSIISSIGSDKFARVRLGVGEKPEQYDLADWVLGHFANEDEPKIREVLGRVTEAVPEILDKGVSEAMGKFNVRIKE